MKLNYLIIIGIILALPLISATQFGYNSNKFVVSTGNNVTIYQNNTYFTTNITNNFTYYNNITYNITSEYNITYNITNNISTIYNITNNITNDYGNASWNQAYAETIFLKIVDMFSMANIIAMITGNYTASIDYSNTNFYNKSSNLVSNGYNISVIDGYLMGQPITGMMGSGLIQSNETNLLTEINITCSGLTCSYNQFEVRLASSTASGPATYCKIPAGSTVVSDNAQVVLYVNSNCAIQQTTIDTWFNQLITAGSVWDFANMVCYDGDCEIVNGIGLESRRMMKQRVLNFHENHLSVVGGFTKSNNAFPGYNINAGEYIYLMDVVETYNVNTSIANSVEYIYQTGAGTFAIQDGTGLNQTSCQSGTAAISCSNPTRYRRSFIFMIGWNETDKDTVKVHQLLPLDSLSYTTEAACLDTVANPLTYTLPSWYTYSAVPLYAYCGQASSSAWSTTGWIDLRTVKAGTSTATSTGDFVPYVGATQNVNLDGFNLTASFLNGDGTNITNILFNYNHTTISNGYCTTNINGNLTLINSNIALNTTNIFLTSNNTYVNKSGDSIKGNMNFTRNNVTDIDYIFLSNKTGACDLTKSGILCRNGSGIYIVG